MSMKQPPQSVALIGAGLGGLTLALALKAHGIEPTLYEFRNPGYDFGGAIMLSPNSLRVLDSLNVYDRIRGKGFNFETLTFKKDFDFKTTAVYDFGGEEKYGYNALRIYRTVLIAELQKAVEEQGIKIEYGRKYTRIISEDPTGVKFAFEDGSEEFAELLIGVDGIHSKVRQYIHPDIHPTYSGFLGVTYAFPASKLRFPKDVDIPVPITINGKNGAFVMAPQNADGTEMFAGRQFRYAMKDRSGWDALLKERTELITMLKGDQDAWSDFARSGMEQAGSPDSHALNIWPFHTVPKMSSWASAGGRVIITGDAAHAIPPTAGQGANQAFEDAFGLAYLLSKLSSKLDMDKAMGLWLRFRQARISLILELSDQMNRVRLSEAERRALIEEEGGAADGELPVQEWRQMFWLYSNDIRKELTEEISMV